MEEGWESLPIGRGELLREGDDLVLIAYGAMVHPALATATLLEEAGLSATVINARFLRPLDQALIHPLARRIGRVGHGGGALPGDLVLLFESLRRGDLLQMLRIESRSAGRPCHTQQSKDDLGLLHLDGGLHSETLFVRLWARSETGRFESKLTYVSGQPRDGERDVAELHW